MNPPVGGTKKEDSCLIVLFHFRTFVHFCISQCFDTLTEAPYNKNTEENVDGYKNYKFYFL